MRKPTIWFLKRHTPNCTSTEDGQKLEVLYLESRGIVVYPCSENKDTDPMKLICVFVFTYADCWFSHDAAQTNFAVQLLFIVLEMF